MDPKRQKLSLNLKVESAEGFDGEQETFPNPSKTKLCVVVAVTHVIHQFKVAVAMFMSFTLFLIYFAVLSVDR